MCVRLPTSLVLFFIGQSGSRYRSSRPSGTSTGANAMPVGSSGSFGGRGSTGGGSFGGSRSGSDRYASGGEFDCL